MKVKVVISTYNGATHLERQLDSIFNQVGVDVSVHIRDDGSQDDTIHIIKNYIEAHPNKKIDLNEGENVGYGKSFWYGLKESGDADYYAFSDQDDVWKPDKLIKCISAMSISKDMPQLSYCRMQRSNEYLEKLDEQISLLMPPQLSKKLVLIKTYNYGAATVINRAAMKLVCRVWPDVEGLPHDMWAGILVYWFGKVSYVDEELYYWIRYDTSVTGEGTRKSGIIFRINESVKKKSYPNISKELLHYFSDLLEKEDRKFLIRICNYKSSRKDKLRLILDKQFVRPSFWGTVIFKFGILMNWF